MILYTILLLLLLILQYNIIIIIYNIIIYYILEIRYVIKNVKLLLKKKIIFKVIKLMSVFFNLILKKKLNIISNCLNKKHSNLNQANYDVYTLVEIKVHTEFVNLLSNQRQSYERLFVR